MNTIISIQPANTPSGAYDVHEKLPYPYHVDADTGLIGRQEFWRGRPARVIGFQNDPNVQQIDLAWDEAANNPDRIKGMFPILADDDGSMYNLTVPITRVTLTDNEEATA